MAAPAPKRVKSQRNPLLELIKDVKVSNQPFSLELFNDKDPFYFHEIMCFVRRAPSTAKPMEMTLYIDTQIMRLLLERWNMWHLLTSDSSEADEHQLYSHLNHYLRENLRYIVPLKDSILKKTFSEKHTIKVKDTYKSLKTLFYYEPHIHDRFYNDIPPPLDLRNSMYYSVDEKFLMNYPHMSVKLDFPHFKAVRYNTNHDIYKLVNLKSFYNEKDVEIQPLGIHYKSSGTGTTLQKWFFNLFIDQLKLCYNNEESVPATIKKGIITVLDQMKEDVSKCGDTLKTQTIYKQNAVPYPYARYLGQPSTTDQYQPHILMQGQMHVGEQNLNLRLQQITYPSYSFVLDKFTPKCVKNDDMMCRFDMGPDYVENLKFGALTFQCALCYISGDIHEMRLHLSMCHGAEPDWVCTTCLNVYSTKYLCMNGWHHKC